MELRQLRYLLSVLDLGTFAAAGEHAHVSQPALWQQVRALEREWQVPLLERSGRRVRPTPVAASLAPKIRAALAAVDGLSADVEAVRAGLAIPARYAAPQYARSAAFMFEAIARHRRRFPESPLPIAVPVGTAATLDALASGRVDLSAGVPPPDWPFQAEPLYEVWLAAIVPPVDDAGPFAAGEATPVALPLAAGGSIEIAALADRPLAVLSSAFQSRRLVEAALRRRGLEPRVAIEHDSPDVLIGAARAGLATAVMVSDALPIGFAGPVAEVVEDGRRIGGTLALTWRSDEALSTAARRLKDEAIALARELRSGSGPGRGEGAPPGIEAGPPRRPPAGRGRCTPDRSRGQPGS